MENLQSSNIVQNFLSNQLSTSTVSLKEGQLIYGKVHRIYGNQTAEIGIGQTKIIAQLDAPIAAGERYLFQVQNSGEITTLKVLPSTGETQTVLQRAQSLLQYLSLIQSKESLALAKFFVKNNSLVTKEQMLQAFQWRKKTDDIPKTLQALKIMNDFSLPFTEHVYRAMVAYGGQDTLPDLFSKVLRGLEQGTTENEQALKTVLRHFLSSDLEKQAESGVQRLVAFWLSEEGEMKKKVFRILQEIGFFPKQESEFFSRSNMEQQSNNLKLFMQFVIKAIEKSDTNSADNRIWKQVQQILQNTEFLSSNHANRLQGGTVSLVSQLSMIVRSGNFEQAKQNVEKVILQVGDGKPVVKGNGEWLQKIVQQEISNLTTPKSEMIVSELKTTFRLLGLGFENYLSGLEHGTTINERELLTLKPLLLKQLTETQSPLLKEHMELLVNKITAQQILSQSSGPIQHLILQFPLPFLLNKNEVTMQWSGKKKQDGSIDPSFCRILFYLQLNHLQETVIDVIVQNSIIKVTILNERATALKVASQPYVAYMKEKLGEAGYTVSSVSFERLALSQFTVQNAPEKEPISYSGVDIKI